MLHRTRLTVQAINERLMRERQFAKENGCPTTELAQIGYWGAGPWSCCADPGAMTVEQAHRAMQVHLECLVEVCRVRRRARRTLVAAGRMVLDERAVWFPDDYE